MRTVYAVLLCALVASCQPVLVREPVGAPVRDDLSQSFDGTWQSDDGRYVFFVKGGGDGRLRVSGLAWNGERYAVQDTSCFVTRVGEWMYLNVPLPRDSAGRRSFMFAPFLLSKGDNMLTAFFPSDTYFREAIGKGEISGTVDKSGYGYTVVEKVDTAFFATHSGEIVTSAEPIVLKRTRPGTSSEAWPQSK